MLLHSMALAGFLTVVVGINAGTEESHDSKTTVAEERPSTAPGDYTLAYKKSVEEDKPLMVVVGAEWCPACEVLKKTTIADMQKTGELDEVSLAVVDRDEEPELDKATDGRGEDDPPDHRLSQRRQGLLATSQADGLSARTAHPQPPASRPSLRTRLESGLARSR